MPITSIVPVDRFSRIGWQRAFLIASRDKNVDNDKSDIMNNIY